MLGNTWWSICLVLGLYSSQRKLAVPTRSWSVGTRHATRDAQEKSELIFQLLYLLSCYFLTDALLIRDGYTIRSWWICCNYYVPSHEGETKIRNSLPILISAGMACSRSRQFIVHAWLLFLRVLVTISIGRPQS